MKRNILKAGFGLLLLGIPMATFAQDIYVLTNAFGNLIRILIPILASVAVLVFFWGLVKYIASKAGDPEKAKEGKSIMVWGAVALFVLFSIWGIIFFIQDSLFIDGGGVMTPPRVNLNPSGGGSFAQ